MICVFAACGDGTFGEIASLDYGKTVKIDTANRQTGGWRNLWQITGDRDPDRPECYLESRTLVRWDGKTYKATSTVRFKRKC